MLLAQGKRKFATWNDYLPQIKEGDEGTRTLIAAVIATAVWDALGQGMTGRNREELVASAWAYLESTMFLRDLELVGFFVDVDVFLRELRELTGDGQGGRVAEWQGGMVKEPSDE